MKYVSSSLRSILFWSIISAAFIGPGTVATAARAGADFGFSLVWALVFATFSAVILQEAAARVTLASGNNLGELISKRFSGSGGYRVRWGLFLSVAFGCAAYQTGNILGARAGIGLIMPSSIVAITLFIGGIAAVIMWFGTIRTIAHVLGVIVACMGIAFILVAVQTEIPGVWAPPADPIDSFSGSAPLLVLGLIGTTIVPYNLFLASGISGGQSVRIMRVGIVGAVVLGGLISVAILIVGTRVETVFSFEALGNALAGSLGTWAKNLFALGLFAAGLSSSVTAPLAASVTGQSLLGDAKTGSWSQTGKLFRTVWITVLFFGVAFGMMNIQPIPAIILAQAINGLLLPVVAIFLLDVLNDPDFIPADFRNGSMANLILVGVVGVAVFLGLNNLGKSIAGAFGMGSSADMSILVAAATGTILVMAWRLFHLVRRNRVEIISGRK